MADLESPGWLGVLFGAAIGSVVGYRAARRGLWGAREEVEEELDRAWWQGHSHGYSEGSHDARELAEGGREDEPGAWGAGYVAGHGDGVRGALDVADRDHASAMDDAFQRGEAAGFTRGWDRAVAEAEARGLLRPRREAHATFPGFGG